MIRVNVPFPMLKDRIPRLIETGLHPEVYFGPWVLDGTPMDQIIPVCREVLEAGLSPTIHAPYLDLSPGSPDLKIRGITSDRINHVLDIAEHLRPKAIVVHSGFDRWRFDGNMKMWLDNSIEFWTPLAKRAEGLGTRLAMENVFDDSPLAIRSLLNAMNTPVMGHCMDIGHFRLFSTIGMEEWFDLLGEKIIEVHIHDNFGKRDDHLPPGDGDIDLPRFFSLLRKYAPEAIYTIEPHREEHLLKNLEVLPGYLNP